MDDLDKIKKYHGRLKRIDEEIKKSGVARDKILAFITKCIITEEQAEKQLENLNKKEQVLQNERQQLNDTLANRPTKEAICDISNKISNQFRRFQLKKNLKVRLAGTKPYTEMTFEELLDKFE